jgi:hypothetical protein
MSNTQEGSTDSTEYEPDFVLPHIGAIREDNWAEYEAKGFGIAIGYDLAAAQRQFGIEHVYTGDAYDWQQGRALRHKPGMTIYVDPEGLAISAEKKRQHEEWMDAHGYPQPPQSASPGPSTS